jgi:prenyl protein peptidase
MLGPIYQQFPKLVTNPSNVDIYLIRSLVVAPIFEEIVFRQLFWLVLKSGGYSDLAISIIGPIQFALAHVHHYRRESVGSIAAKIAHTCIFGWLGFYFLIQRSIWDSILAHALCNYIGLPSDCIKNPYILAIYSVGLVLFIASI